MSEQDSIQRDDGQGDPTQGLSADGGDSTAAALLFRTDRDRWEPRGHFEPGETVYWHVGSNASLMRAGQLALFCKEGSRPEPGGVFGWGLTLGDPQSSEGSLRIETLYVERWLARGTTGQPGRHHLVPIPELPEVENWGRPDWAIGRPDWVTRAELDEIQKRVSTSFPDSNLPDVVATVLAGSTLDPASMFPATIVEAPPHEATAAPVSLRMFSDAPIRTMAADRLGFARYADAIAGLINEDRTSTPLTLAINARWGVGKSSLGHMVEDALTHRSRLKGLPHVTCWFDAWMHDDAQDLTPALLAHVARAASAERPLWRRLLQPIPIALLPRGERWRHRFVRLAMVVLVGLALTIGALALKYQARDVQTLWSAVTSASADLGAKVLDPLGGDDGTTADATIQSRVGGSAWVVLLGLLAKGWTILFGVAKALTTFVVNPSDEAQAGSLNRVRQQLGSLIEQATREGRRRFVLFIDDLERCRPPLAVSLLETVNQLLNLPNVVTVVMADMPGVEAHVQIKYKDLAARYRVGAAEAPSQGQDEALRSRTYGAHYLRKIIQLQFDLPQPATLPRNLEPPAESEASAGELLRETAAHLFDFADGRRLNPLEPLRDNISRWSDRASFPRGLITSFWFLCLPALMVGGLAEILARFLPPNSGFRAPASTAMSSAVAGGLGLLSAPLLVWVGIRRLVPPSNPPLGGPDLVYLIVLGGVLVTVLLMRGLEGWTHRRMLKRLSDRIDEAVRRAQTAGEDAPDVSDVVAAIEDPALAKFAERPAGQDLLRERRFHHLGDDSKLHDAAWETADKRLPRIPRHVKRFQNRLRLLLYVADRHDMFAQDGENRARMVGKWAVIQEVWPALAQRLFDQPARMEALEEEPERELALLVPGTEKDQRLLAVLRDTPRLGKRLASLTTFALESEPAEAPGGDPALG